MYKFPNNFIPSRNTSAKLTSFQDGDFYYGLSQNNGKFDGALSKNDLSPENVVKTLWQKICK